MYKLLIKTSKYAKILIFLFVCKFLLVSELFILDVFAKEIKKDMKNDKETKKDMKIEKITNDTERIIDKLKSIVSELRTSNIQVEPAGIGGLYVIYVDNSTPFFYDDKGYFIFGEIITDKGNNLVGELSVKRFYNYVKSNNISPHLVLSNKTDSPEMVVILNPECNFCRNLVSFLYRNKVYNVFKLSFYFIPLELFQQGDFIAANMLCSIETNQMSKEQVLEAYIDRKPFVGFCDRERVNSYMESIKKLGVVGISQVPIVYVPNEDLIIVGFNQRIMLDLLDKYRSN